MKMKKTITRIFLERRKVTITRTAPQELDAFCIACARDVRMVSAPVAAGRMNLEVSAIYGAVACEAVHSTETAGGLLLICSDSLRQAFENSNAKHRLAGRTLPKEMSD